MGESGDKKGIKREISSHGGQVSNAWSKRIVRRNWGYKREDCVFKSFKTKGREFVSNFFFFFFLKDEI